jgi:hypothetical protein
MFKYAVAEYALWYESVAAQSHLCAIQSWQIHVHGDGLCTQHIWPGMWHGNCSLSSLLGYSAQCLNFRQKKNYNKRERGMIVFVASE